MEKQELSWEKIKEMFAEIARRQEETTEQMKETDRKMQETDRKLEKLGLNIGGISNSNGEFAEEYFFNSLEIKKEFAGIHFNVVSKAFGGVGKMPNGKDFEDQFDIVMVNDKSIALIEIKYKAKDKYVEDLVTRKVRNFKILFPRYENFGIYLGLGSLSFDKETIEKAKEHGVGLLRQVGETIEYKADWEVRAY